MTISPYAGKPAVPALLANIPKLITAYYALIPDSQVREQQVQFGTSGHRGSSLQTSFNEWHILAITQAICQYRSAKGINGPLFIGADTHALSEPALASALEVLAANQVETMLAKDNDYVPTPAISLAILTYNRGRKDGFADGIVITPSHNPPTDGGFKYNPPNGGPAGDDITGWVQNRANELLTAKLAGVKRVSVRQALSASTTHYHDYLQEYVDDLTSVVDLDLIRSSGLHIGADPLGRAGVHCWQPIADKYKLNLEAVNKEVDPTFRFMTVDWDGQIRMDPSSSYAMARLIGMKDRFDISVACDTDHDRHGIVTKD